MMKKKRFLPSMLMIIGFLLLILFATALPSASESSRPVVMLLGAGSAALILAGIALGARKK
ncbi:MAG: hypothetical protein GY859_08830 [Desulfobacterales bacterium]|nr:hypothetical protein [Desulfobacterales bacterium]